MIPPDVQQSHENVEILEIDEPFDMANNPHELARFRDQVDEALDMTKRVWDAGGEIWFHCQGGHTRSPNFALMMVVAYMGNKRLLDALQAVYTNMNANANCHSDYLDVWGQGLPEGSDAQKGVAWVSQFLKDSTPKPH